MNEMATEDSAFALSACKMSSLTWKSVKKCQNFSQSLSRREVNRISRLFCKILGAELRERGLTVEAVALKGGVATAWKGVVGLQHSVNVTRQHTRTLLDPCMTRTHGCLRKAS